LLHYNWRHNSQIFHSNVHIQFLTSQTKPCLTICLIFSPLILYIHRFVHQKNPVQIYKKYIDLKSERTQTPKTYFWLFWIFLIKGIDVKHICVISIDFNILWKKLNVHITVKYLTVVPPVIMEQWMSVILLPPIVTTLMERSHFLGGRYCIRACKLDL
jgi:hypothetical protein